MAQVNVKTNAKEVNRRIQKYVDNTEKTALRRAFKRIGPELKEAGQDAAPVDQGYLKDAIEFRIRRRKGETQVRLGYDFTVAAHGAVVELGTANAPAQPYLRPALEAVAEQAEDAIIEELNRLGRQVGRGG